MSQGSTTPSDFESAFQKYQTGMEIILEGAKAETGKTPKEVIWTKNKAKLYHYEPTAENECPVAIRLFNEPSKGPYVLDSRPGNSMLDDLAGEALEGTILDATPAG